jgi:ribosome-associated toxin RatA of RatAB toxin-antitoxin module
LVLSVKVLTAVLVKDFNKQAAEVEAVVVIVETAVAVETKLLLQHHQAIHNPYLVLSVKVLTAVLVKDFNKQAAEVELVKLVEV